MRAWSGALPVTLTLPRSFDPRRRRRQRALRLAIGALVTLGVALLAAGFWLPARAELAQHLLNRPWQRTTDSVAVIAKHRDTHLPALANLAVGDELDIEGPDGSAVRYTVASLDVVDITRAELALDADDSVVVLVTRWPFDAARASGPWRYVVTARQRF